MIVRALIVWLLLSGAAALALSPLLAARMADRPMTPAEREQLGWSGLAVALALFLLAVLIIGAHS